MDNGDDLDNVFITGKPYVISGMLIVPVNVDMSCAHQALGLNIPNNHGVVSTVEVREKLASLGTLERKS